ncbi:MAG: hypothetical protein ACLSG5_07925 [Oscillospiraceae bacterium]
MAERPWVTPEELKEYTEFEEVKNRAIASSKLTLPGGELGHRLLQQQIRRPGEIPEIPENVKTAVLLIAEAYAHNAVEQTKSVSKRDL